MWVTYITIYKGNKLPPFYIGYTKKTNIKKGYRGSVKSKKYSQIWKQEIKNNSFLFDTKIITEHETKEDALEKEEYLQKCLSVHKNNLYINQTISGKYFTFEKGKKLSEDHKKKIGIANSKALKGRKLSESTKQKMRGRKHTQEFKEKMSLLHKGNQYGLGKKLTEEHKNKLKGRIPWNKGMKGFMSGNKHYRFGKKVSEKTKNKISNTLKNNSCRSKKYIIIHPDGKIEYIKGLKKYCDLMNWPYKYVITKCKLNKKYQGYYINEHR